MSSGTSTNGVELLYLDNEKARAISHQDGLAGTIDTAIWEGELVLLWEYRDSGKTNLRMALVGESTYRRSMSFLQHVRKVAVLLLYAIDEGSPRHEQASEWLEGVLSGTEAVAFAEWRQQLAQSRCVAVAGVEHGGDGLGEPAVDVVEPPPATSPRTPTSRRWRSSTAPSSAPAMPDFSRFDGLRWKDPLR